jgi:hypothetical protein
MLSDANLDDAVLSRAWVWRAEGANCDKTQITDLRNDAVMPVRRRHGREELISANPDQIEKFIKQWTSGIQDKYKREQVSETLRERLTADPTKDHTLAIGWSRCESTSGKLSPEEFDRRHVAVLRKTVCNVGTDGATIGRGVARNWISKDRQGRGLTAKDNERREFSAKLARALLGEDGEPCAPANDYDQDTKALLRRAAGPPSAAPPDRGD